MAWIPEVAPEGTRLVIPLDHGYTVIKREARVLLFEPRGIVVSSFARIRLHQAWGPTIYSDGARLDLRVCGVFEFCRKA